MSYDTVASLQRMQQLQQAQAASGKRIVLKRVYKSDKISALIIVLLYFSYPSNNVYIPFSWISHLLH